MIINIIMLDVIKFCYMDFKTVKKVVNKYILKFIFNNASIVRYAVFVLEISFCDFITVVASTQKLRFIPL